MYGNTLFWTSFSCCGFPIRKKPIHFVEGHKMNITTKFGAIWPNGFREED